MLRIDYAVELVTGYVRRREQAAKARPAAQDGQTRAGPGGTKVTKIGSMESLMRVLGR